MSMNKGRERLADQRIVVGLSGGVDSAVAAALLVHEGYEVHGVTLRTWHLEPPRHDPTVRAQMIADSLGIPLMVQDVETRFYSRVVEPFVKSYSIGLTPNPCVFCNPTLKFATLLQVADALDARWVATGHYARTTRDAHGMAHLWRGRAKDKDQSYALYRLSQTQLQHIIFPLGEVASKHEVCDFARRTELPVAEVSESQDLCFMSGRHYTQLIETLLPHSLRPGPILDENGRVLGQHKGLHRYTIGQRGGLGIAAEHPLYVLRHDVAHNALVVGPRERLARQDCQATAVVFTQGNPPDTSFSAMARIRYRAQMVKATVTVLSPDRIHVRFHQPQYGVAPGQSLVLYRDEEVLGGGVITPPEE